MILMRELEERRISDGGVGGDKCSWEGFVLGPFYTGRHAREHVRDEGPLRLNFGGKRGLGLDKSLAGSLNFDRVLTMLESDNDDAKEFKGGLLVLHCFRISLGSEWSIWSKNFQPRAAFSIDAR